MKHPIVLTAIVILLILVTYLTINYDQQIFSAIRAMQNPALDVVMLMLTSLATLYIGVPVIIAILYFTNRKKIVWDLLISLIIGILLTLVLKTVIARPRPDEILNFGFLVSATFSSFPSDHASTAFMIGGVLGHYFKRYKLWLYLLAVLVAFSRVYLGAHYPTDVLVGAFIGILVSQLVIRYGIGKRVRSLLKRR